MSPQDLIFWRTNGYFVIEEMLSPQELQRVQAVFEREMARQFPQPAAQPQADARFLKDFLDADPLFAELADHPGLMPVLTEAFGDDLILTLANASTYPPGAPQAYWHSDLWHFIGMNLAHDCYMARVLLFLDDVEPEGGCLAYVPGSHRLDQMTIVNPPRFDDAGKMPNHVRFAVRAGTAVVFNSYGWHARLPNNSPSGRPRRTLQYGYCHAWVQFMSQPLAPRSAESVATTDLRRQLFGLKPVPYSYELIETMLRAKAAAPRGS